MNAAASFRDQELNLPTVQLKIRQFELRELNEPFVPDSERHILGMRLTPTPEETSACYAHNFAPTEYQPLGRLTFFPAGVPVHFPAGIGRLWALQCTFDAQIFDPLAIDWNRERLREALHVRNASVAAACDRVVAEMSEPGFASTIAIESLCSLMVVDLTRHFACLSATSGGGLPAWRVRRIEERLRAGGAPPALSELAALCGMSPRHLTRAFRQQTGSTLTDWATEIRTSRAKELLAADALSVKQIGESLGFAQLSNFSTAFLRAAGERPSAYRARMHSERFRLRRAPAKPVPSGGVFSPGA